MKKLIILSAPPGSGKSSWARNYQKEHENTYIISSDEIRYELTNQKQDFSKQKEVWEIFSRRIHEYALKGDDINIILDALCDLNCLREKYVKENPEYDKYILVLFPHKFEDIKKLNRQRPKDQIVPDDALLALYQKFEEPNEEIKKLFDEIIEIRF